MGSDEQIRIRIRNENLGDETYQVQRGLPARSLLQLLQPIRSPQQTQSLSNAATTQLTHTSDSVHSKTAKNNTRNDSATSLSAHS